MSASFISDKDRTPAQLAISMYGEPPEMFDGYALAKKTKRAALYTRSSAAIVAIRGTALNDSRNALDDSVSLFYSSFGAAGGGSSRATRACSAYIF